MRCKPAFRSAVRICRDQRNSNCKYSGEIQRPVFLPAESFVQVQRNTNRAQDTNEGVAHCRAVVVSAHRTTERLAANKPAAEPEEKGKRNGEHAHAEA